MIKYLLIILLCVVMGASARVGIPNVELTPQNLVSLTTDVNPRSVTNVIWQLEHNNSKAIYLYINSPGGDIVAGYQLVQYLLVTHKNIQCIAAVAASMAHVILEACPVRLGTPINILLQHKAAVGIAPSSASQIEQTLKVLTGLELVLNTLEAKRIGVSLEEFEKRTFYPWITFGPESIKENMIDKIVTVTCSSELYNTVSYLNVTNSARISTAIQISRCPLLPISEVP